MDTLSSETLTLDNVNSVMDKSINAHILGKVLESAEIIQDVKLADLPQVHQSAMKTDRGEMSCDGKWVLGSSKGQVLQFRCSALSNPPTNPPASNLHMTYKTIQAETKLLAAVLGAHGLREVVSDYLNISFGEPKSSRFQPALDGNSSPPPSAQEFDLLPTGQPFPQVCTVLATSMQYHDL
uniref:Uncharacterized protein n=1 Tax=Timema bartmani TaxID=61472 RepID=A0A7R9EMT5_9NEOP|nr:unnamed protein product [Timema bartmani]